MLPKVPNIDDIPSIIRDGIAAPRVSVINWNLPKIRSESAVRLCNEVFMVGQSLSDIC